MRQGLKQRHLVTTHLPVLLVIIKIAYLDVLFQQIIWCKLEAIQFWISIIKANFTLIKDSNSFGELSLFLKGLFGDFEPSN